jgi:hypothetical protein
VTDEATPPVKCPLCSSAFVRIWEAGQTAKYTCGTEWCLKENKPYGVGFVCGMKLHAAHARLLAVKQAAERLKAIHDGGEVEDNIVPLMEAEDALWAALAACNEQEAGE